MKILFIFKISLYILEICYMFSNVNLNMYINQIQKDIIHIQKDIHKL